VLVAYFHMMPLYGDGSSLAGERLKGGVMTGRGISNQRRSRPPAADRYRTTRVLCAVSSEPFGSAKIRSLVYNPSTLGWACTCQSASLTYASGNRRFWCEAKRS
jgi:hypothetical protein